MALSLRNRAKPELFVFQIAPLVDVLLVLLIFFIVTWNFALTENELEVKIPDAAHSKESRPVVGQLVLNVRADGTIVVNRQVMSPDDLRAKLSKLSGLYPDQAVILRADRGTDYVHIVDILDICRSANIWNIAFATGKVAAPAR